MTEAKKTINVNFEEGGVADVTIDGTKVAEISPDGDVVAYTDKSAQLAKPAFPPSATTQTSTSLYVLFSPAFNSVSMYGARIEIAPEGDLTIYTNGKVFAKPAFANDTAVEALKIGMKMKDGTFYVGISPDTGRRMYAAPSDAPMRLDFNQAAKYAQDFEVGGKKGFRVPSLAELNVVRDALLQNEEMKATFNLTDLPGDGLYWSSASNVGSYAQCQRLSNGVPEYIDRSQGMLVRPVRS